MEPLSARTRRMYLALFFTLFFAMLPAIIFYADGWRYKSGYGFVRTGGIYVSVPYPDAHVSVNGDRIGTSGFLERNFYVGDLAPAAYMIHVERDGYRSWDRLLVVEEQLVTDARALLIPEEITSLKLVVATSTIEVNNSTTTRQITRAAYNSYLAIFTATTTASSTIPIDEAGGTGLFIDKGKLYSRWIQEDSFPLSQYCGRPSVCVNEIILEKDSPVITARFFRDGVVYVTREGKVYFREIDVRESPIFTQIFSAKGSDIRVIDDTLIVKVGTTFYTVVM